MEVKEILQKGFWTILARLVGAGLMFLMTILFARWLGASSFGLFSLGLTLMTIMSMISRWGTDQVLLKQVGSHWESDPYVSKQYTLSVVRLVLLISVSTGFIVAYFSNEIALLVFHKPEFSEILFWFSLMIVPFSLNFTFSEAYKGHGRPILSTYLQTVSLPFFAIAMTSFYIIYFEPTLLVVTLIYALAAFLSVLLSLFFWKLIFNDVKVNLISLKKIAQEGRPMLLISFGALVLAWSDMVIIGILGENEELGVYSAASRTVLIISLLLFAMNSITAPKYARMYKNKEIESLRKLAQNTSLILAVLAFIPTFVIVIFPGWVLSLFGPTFAEGATVLIILAVGQFINVAAGSVGYILTMSGHERLVTKAVAISALFNIFASLLLYIGFGIEGVALSTMISIVLFNLICIKNIRKHLGFNPVNFSLKRP